MLLVCYIIVFILAFCTPDTFLSVAFDSGGVTTGPITVPFIMALGIGMASMRNDKNSGSDSFGFVSLGSVGPIIAVMLLGIFYKPQGGNFSMAELGDIQTTRDAARVFLEALPAYAEEVLIAIVPIVVVFLIFQLITRRFQKHQLGKMAIGIVYAYVGLVMFLTGVNVGFMPSGQMIGSGLAGSAVPWILVLVGMVVGYFIVRAEPAVQILTRQVEDVSNGSVTQKAMMNALSIGVAISVGLAMLRILTGLPIMALMIPRLHRGPGPHLPGAPAVHQHRLRLRRRGLRPHDHHVPAAPGHGRLQRRGRQYHDRRFRHRGHGGHDAPDHHSDDGLPRHA